MTSLLASFFKRNVALNMGARDTSSPQTLYPSPKKATRYFEDGIVYDDSPSGLSDVFWKIVNGDTYYGPSKSDGDWPKETINYPREYLNYKLPLFKPFTCPYCGKQYYKDSVKKCEHWDGAFGWTKKPRNAPENYVDSRFGYQFKEEFEKKFPDDIYNDAYRTSSKKEEAPKSDGAKITKSRRGEVISGYGRIDSGFDWE